MSKEGERRVLSADEMARRDAWAQEVGIDDRERGFRLFENAQDRIVNVYNRTDDLELARAILDMDTAFFAVFTEKTKVL